MQGCLLWIGPTRLGSFCFTWVYDYTVFYAMFMGLLGNDSVCIFGIRS